MFVLSGTTCIQVQAISSRDLCKDGRRILKNRLVTTQFYKCLLSKVKKPHTYSIYLIFANNGKLFQAKVEDILATKKMTCLVSSFGHSPCKTDIQIWGQVITNIPNKFSIKKQADRQTSPKKISLPDRST